MKTSQSILIIVALLAFIASDAPAKVEARTSPEHVSFAKACTGLPLPIAHVRFAGDALIYSLGYRSAGSRTAPTRMLVTLRLIVSPSGKVGFSILAHNFRLAFPRRSA